MVSKKDGRYSLATKARLWLVARIFQDVAAFLGRCPERFFPVLARGFGTLGYYFIRERRRTGLKNVEIVWGDRTTVAQRKALVKAVFRNITRDLLEVGYSYFKPEYIAAMNIVVHGREHLDTALAKGRGIIAVTAHLGNFPVIGCQLALMGYPSWLIFKSPKNPGVAKKFGEWMDRVGICVIPYKPRRVCARESLRVLKNNGIVQLLIDQNPRKRYGTYVEFFGYAVPTYTGPVVMARRSGAALVPMYMHRGGDGNHTLTILPEIPVNESKERIEGIRDNLRAVNKHYEAWITAHPEQWWWIHRRFRRARAISGASRDVNG